MRRVLSIIAALVLLAAAGSTVLADASDQAGQCAGYNSPANIKTDTSDGSIVLAAGLTVCIHASNGNTGTFVTDGTSTLADYIEASGLLNNGGQVPGVSNYVVYGAAATASPTPSATPSGTPKATPSETPVETPVVTPSDQPSESPRNEVPNTAMSDDRPLNISLFGWIAGGIFIIMGVVYALTMAQKPRK